MEVEKVIFKGNEAQSKANITHKFVINRLEKGITSSGEDRSR